MRNTRFYLLAIALSGAGCTANETQLDSDRLGLAQRAEAAAAGRGGPRPVVQVDAGQVVLDCPRGGAVGMIHVEFACDAITIYSCKDLSNVVLEFEDGTRERFEDLAGRQGTFSGTGANAGDRVVRVWVKAGANFSGDGPGYGERFDAPDGDCVPPDGGMAGSGGGGAGGTGDEDPCQDNDPDTFCGEGEPGEPGDPGTAGSGGNESPCIEDPANPACHVD